jgi:rhomboid-like protein
MSSATAFGTLRPVVGCSIHTATSCSRKLFVRPLGTPRATFMTTTHAAAGQALGRITPKRIAIPLPPGSTSGQGGLPRRSVWRPVVVRALFFMSDSL